MQVLAVFTLKAQTLPHTFCSETGHSLSILRHTGLVLSALSRAIIGTRSNKAKLAALMAEPGDPCGEIRHDLLVHSLGP
jgi:hypothetical protein